MLLFEYFECSKLQVLKHMERTLKLSANYKSSKIQLSILTIHRFIQLTRIYLCFLKSTLFISISPGTGACSFCWCVNIRLVTKRTSCSCSSDCWWNLQE